MRFIEPIIGCLKLNSWNAHLYLTPTSSDSISGVQLEIIRRTTGRLQKTYQSLIWTPPPLIKNSPSRRRLKFFGALATPWPPMALMIFAAADLYLISVGPCYSLPTRFQIHLGTCSQMYGFFNHTLYSHFCILPHVLFVETGIRWHEAVEICPPNCQLQL